jgi:2-keto-4-pentenoate hydratase/2-oxohepta-3-ene-1,7-dioic acid hydratase in catechol pathway
LSLTARGKYILDKIICVGKNYLEHAKELGDKVPEKPVIFLKPASVLVQASSWGSRLKVQYPQRDDNVHHECEIVLRVCKGGYRMRRLQAEVAVDAVTLGLDMTLRNCQTKLKQNGHPWTIGKVFPDAAIIGPWIPMEQFQNFNTTSFHFYVNDGLRQTGNATQMLMPIVDLILYVSEFFPLCEGDLIFTGTPAGVNSISLGDSATLQWGEYEYHVQWD